MLSLAYDCPAWKFVACRGLGWAWPGVYFSRLAPGRLRELHAMGRLPQGWARVRIRQCGLCASDLPLLFLDVSPNVAPSAMFDARYASVMGHELVGEVSEAGEGCRWQVGQRVVSRSGGFRNCFNLGTPPCRYCQMGEYALCLNQGAPPPGHERIRSGGFSAEYVEHGANLLEVPAGLSDDEAAMVEPLACSLRAVARGMQGRETGAKGRVLIVGAGIQGLGAVHWLSRLFPQTSLTVAARYSFQAELARKLGAGEVLEGVVDTVRLADQMGTRLIKGLGRNQLLADGFDVVIDAVGSPQTLHDALRWARPGGRVVLLGAHLHRGRMDYSPIWFRQVDVCGVYAHGMEEFEGRRVPTLQLVMELLQSRAPLGAVLATHHLALADYRRAVELMTNKARSRAVKVMLRPGGVAGDKVGL